MDHLIYAIVFAAAGLLVIIFRDRFIEWVANRNRRFGITKRHDRAARFTAWFIGVTLLALGFVSLVILVQGKAPFRAPVRTP